MKPLSYEARTEIPKAGAIDRIVNAVIAEAQHRDQIHHPDDLMPQSHRAKVMAREIKRRLCQLISVEVDLVITGSTDEDDAPAPATQCAKRLTGGDISIYFPLSSTPPLTTRTLFRFGSLLQS